ncbi:hypothetical protein TYRP_022498 [Tyrophagus putrescentiae]|nr:hypothetical protein TYRP_022498 [Tyrophagus putrescentiae]
MTEAELLQGQSSPATVLYGSAPDNYESLENDLIVVLCIRP